MTQNIKAIKAINALNLPIHFMKDRYDTNKLALAILDKALAVTEQEQVSWQKVSFVSF